MSSKRNDRTWVAWRFVTFSFKSFTQGKTFLVILFHFFHINNPPWKSTKCAFMLSKRRYTNVRSHFFPTSFVRYCISRTQQESVFSHIPLKKNWFFPLLIFLSVLCSENSALKNAALCLRRRRRKIALHYISREFFDISYFLLFRFSATNESFSYCMWNSEISFAAK